MFRQYRREDVDTVASSVKVAEDVSTESHRTEQLNDEEQAVLDGYRRLRLTKPAERASREPLNWNFHRAANIPVVVVFIGY
jgi:hypothetical protein